MTYEVQELQPGRGLRDLQLKDDREQLEGTLD